MLTELDACRIAVVTTVKPALSCVNAEMKLRFVMFSWYHWLLLAGHVITHYIAHFISVVAPPVLFNVCCRSFLGCRQVLYVRDKKKGGILEGIGMQISRFSYEIIQGTLKTSLNLNCLTEIAIDLQIKKKRSPRHPISSRKREREVWTWRGGWERKAVTDGAKEKRGSQRGGRRDGVLGRVNSREREEVTEERMQTKEEEG